MAKVVGARPDWIKAPNVVAVRSVSNCVSHAFCDYINHWKHNGYWFFNSPSVIDEIAVVDADTAANYEVFYYELYEFQFVEENARWESYRAEDSFRTAVKMPERMELLGFDVVSYSAQTSPECSPLSCNNLAERIEVNEHCLLRSFDEAKRLLESGAFTNSEPGPFRIAAVYRPYTT